METLKNWLAKFQGTLLLILGLASAILYILWKSETNKVEVLQSKISLANTEQETQVIQKEIESELDKAKQAGKNADDLEKLFTELEKKRALLKAQELSDKEVEDFYNKGNS